MDAWETRYGLNTMNSIQELNRKTPTLRDSFAMSVMAAFAGGSWNGTCLSSVIEQNYATAERLAIASYRVADAMMKARELSEEELNKVENVVTARNALKTK